MSNTIAQNLSEAQLAAIAAIVNGEAVKSEAQTEPPSAVSKKTGFILIRALGTTCPDDEVVTVNSKSDEVAYWDDGTPITFGDLRFTVEDGATRADGTKCRDYPNVWLLTQDAAYAAIQIANRFAAKPKASGGFKPKASGKAPVQPKADDARIERLEALVLQLAEGQFKQSAPAKPEPTVGHRKVAATPTPKALPDFKPGDVIRVNGVAVQISDDGKRLNKTIATK